MNTIGKNFERSTVIEIHISHLRAMPVVSILMSTMYQYSFVLKGIIRE